ncbi:MAG: caspase family protein [Flavobacteriales bacterium]|nr:caspase family protein [Flavobacteriales bacterium]
MNQTLPFKMKIQGSQFPKNACAFSRIAYQKIIPFIFLIAFSFSPWLCQCQTNRALLIGINNYQKPDSAVHLKTRSQEITNLLGCENDVMVMDQILQARFGFEASNISWLLNHEATHDAILIALNEQLQVANSGDVFFFLFSGHGSQIRNPLSIEPDKKDETIVPADGIYAGKLIRDKELANLFQQFIDKGVTVTAIFECCHSGSMARGVSTGIKMLATGDEVIQDDRTYPQPEKNGALIISAAQDFEVAQEYRFGDQTVHGSFLKCMADVIAGSPTELNIMECERLLNVTQSSEFFQVVIHFLVTHNVEYFFFGFSFLPITKALLNELEGNFKKRHVGFGIRLLSPGAYPETSTFMMNMFHPQSFQINVCKTRKAAKDEMVAHPAQSFRFNRLAKHAINFLLG